MKNFEIIFENQIASKFGIYEKFAHNFNFHKKKKNVLKKIISTNFGNSVSIFVHSYYGPINLFILQIQTYEKDYHFSSIEF